jgi:carbamoyl-phosphate synthase large subunit
MKKMRILITAIGRRVQLIKYLKNNCYIIGVDCGDTAPTIQFVDKFYNVPKYNDSNYIECLLDLCKKEDVDMIIPLFELEFKLLCRNREKFEFIGTTLLLSNKRTIDICNDKWKTYCFFKQNNINTPKSFLKDKIYDNLRFPYIIKPINGMGSAGVFKVKNIRELEFFKEYIDNPIIQEFVEGTEYTVDVLCDLNSNVIAVVPRVRMEVRSGEVSKSKTVKNTKIILETINLCNKLKFIGPVTIQCIETKYGEIKFIEINPRFGGGVPLSFEAGVDYGQYFNMMIKNKHIEPIIGEFKELTMIRYDEAIFK